MIGVLASSIYSMRLLYARVRDRTLYITDAYYYIVRNLIGGVMALLIALTRWPAVHLLPQDLFYRFITAHGLNMLVFWIVFLRTIGVAPLT